jgi:hypothetical protein
MTWWQYAIWGGFGGLAVEFLELYGAIRRTGDWPWRRAGEPRPVVFAVSVAIRVGLGMGLAAAAGDTDQISGALGAVAIGVAAPFLLEQMARQVPVREPEPPRVMPTLPTITEEPRVHVND